MKRNRDGASRLARTGFVVKDRPHWCEALEGRALLDGNDPVIVLTEPVSLTTFTDPNFPPVVTSSTVRPWLWDASDEYDWDLDEGDWDTENDADGNGYNGDAYGWNFNNGEIPEHHR